MHYMQCILKEGRIVVVLFSALGVVELKRELLVLDVAHIVRIERARLIIHSVFESTNFAKRLSGDARQLEDASGVLGPYCVELGQERGLILC